MDVGGSNWLILVFPEFSPVSSDGLLIHGDVPFGDILLLGNHIGPEQWLRDTLVASLVNCIPFLSVGLEDSLVSIQFASSWHDNPT